VKARARILLLSDRKWNRPSIAEATGTSISTVGRVRTAYCEAGLEAALFERPRPGAATKLSDRQRQKVIALVCSDAPEGFARWSVRLLTEEVIRSGIAESLSRETIRLLLRDHGLKPWREKNVVHSKAGR
jgi:putative transposase